MARKVTEHDIETKLASLNLAERALLRRVAHSHPICLNVDAADASLAVRLWTKALLRPVIRGQRHSWRLAGTLVDKREILLQALLRA